MWTGLLDSDFFFCVYLVYLNFACVSCTSALACPFTSPTRASHKSLITIVNFHTTHSGSAMHDLRVWTQTMQWPLASMGGTQRSSVGQSGAQRRSNHVPDRQLIGECVSKAHLYLIPTSSSQRDEACKTHLNADAEHWKQHAPLSHAFLFVYVCFGWHANTTKHMHFVEDWGWASIFRVLSA